MSGREKWRLASAYNSAREPEAAWAKRVILADTKIIDRAKEAVTLFAQAGADWVTVMAGTSKNVIHACCTTAHELGKRVMLDLLDASSPGQSAMEAKTLGVDALLFHQPYEEQDLLTLRDKWEMVKGNSALPIFIAADVRRETIEELTALKPDGLVIGKAITTAEEPAAEAAFFHGDTTP